APPRGRSALGNARAYLHLDEEEGSFWDGLWAFVDGEPVRNQWKQPAQRPAETPLAVEVSKALKARVFSLVGPTIVYAFMQAVGIVNDHLVGCYRHSEVEKL